jgi:hypothetical protein
MFEQWPQARKQIMNALGGDLTHLRSYKTLIKAMFKGISPENVPVDISDITEEPSEEDIITTHKKLHSAHDLQKSFAKVQVHDAIETPTQLLEPPELPQTH